MLRIRVMLRLCYGDLPLFVALTNNPFQDGLILYLQLEESQSWAGQAMSVTFLVMVQTTSILYQLTMLLMDVS